MQPDAVPCRSPCVLQNHTVAIRGKSRSSFDLASPWPARWQPRSNSSSHRLPPRAFVPNAHSRFGFHPQAQFGQRVVHRAKGRLQNVNFVDNRVIAPPDAVMNRGKRCEFCKESVPFFSGQLLGIVQSPQRARQSNLNPLTGKDYSRRHNRPGQRAAPGFVDARDQGASAREEFALVTES